MTAQFSAQLAGNSIARNFAFRFMQDAGLLRRQRPTFYLLYAIIIGISEKICLFALVNTFDDHCPLHNWSKLKRRSSGYNNISIGTIDDVLAEAKLFLVACFEIHINEHRELIAGR